MKDLAEANIATIFVTFDVSHQTTRSLQVVKCIEEDRHDSNTSTNIPAVDGSIGHFPFSLAGYVCINS